MKSNHHFVHAWAHDSRIEWRVLLRKNLSKRIRIMSLVFGPDMAFNAILTSISYADEANNFLIHYRRVIFPFLKRVQICVSRNLTVDDLTSGHAGY